LEGRRHRGQGVNGDGGLGKESHGGEQRCEATRVRSKWRWFTKRYRPLASGRPAAFRCRSTRGSLEANTGLPFLPAFMALVSLAVLGVSCRADEVLPDPTRPSLRDPSGGCLRASGRAPSSSRFRPHDTLAALPVCLPGGANPHPRLPPPPWSLGADIRRLFEANIRSIAYGPPRIPLPRRWLNKGIRKGRNSENSGPLMKR
jgi:hypothetical protein